VTTDAEATDADCNQQRPAEKKETLKGGIPC
jgi:hypothetical protein